MITRHVETIFSDDVRQEVGSKLSFIGVYSEGLYVQDFPVTLPKLCITIKIVTPAEEPLNSLQLLIFKDEEVLQEITVDEDQLANAVDQVSEMLNGETKDRAHTAQFGVVFSPIKFTESCTIRVRAITESGELKGVGLKIDKAQS
jgi:hypothetical protein